MKTVVHLFLAVCLQAAALSPHAEPPRSIEPAGWQEALKGMPWPAETREINRQNFAPAVLHAFQSNDVVRSLILMPGATDRFYFFKQPPVPLPHDTSSLWNALTVLRDQTPIRLTFVPPHLLVHAGGDPLSPLAEVNWEIGRQRLQSTPFRPHVLWDDVGWDNLVPLLETDLGAVVLPRQGSADSWHFFRHSLAAWNLTQWQTLEALSLAGKTRFQIGRTRISRKLRIEFQGDKRSPPGAPLQP